jgi:kynurenine formamidase
MSILQSLVSGLRGGAIEVVDLTAPLSAETPILKLPEPFADTATFSLEEISRYDDRGPAWYWNNIHTGEHTGTHLDAPVHWVTAKDGEDVSRIATRKLIAPAAVIDVSGRVERDHDFLLEIGDLDDWQDRHGPLPDGGWLLIRTGWDARSDSQEAFLNADETGPHTPGVSVGAAKWLAEVATIIGVGVETVGTDAGKAHSFEPAFPCHTFVLGAGKYGLTQLQNLRLLPPTGAVVVAGPLPIVGGSGSPARVLALVER